MNHLFPFSHYSRTCSSALLQRLGLRAGEAPIFARVRQRIGCRPPGLRPRGDVLVHGQFDGLLRRIRDVVHVSLQVGDEVQGALAQRRPWRFGESAAQDAPQATTSGDDNARRVEAEIKVRTCRSAPFSNVARALFSASVSAARPALGAAPLATLVALAALAAFPWAAAAAAAARADEVSSAACLASRAASNFLILFFI